MSSSSTAENNDKSTTPVSAEQLKKFLHEAPAMYKYRLHRGAERQILTNCYRLLWGNNHALMKKYFFTSSSLTMDDHDASNDNLSMLLEKYNLFKRGDDDNTVAVPSNPDNVLVDHASDEPEYWETQRGKQCGHLFKKGESVYRCRTCGLDDTCVLCARCFHSTNHDGHDVKIWISRGAGGCCDCGDPEAWKIPLICSIHSLSAAPTTNTAAETSSSSADNNTKSTRAIQLEPRTSVTPELLEQIKATIQVVMDYILETFATSPENLSLRDKQQIQQDCEASDKALGMPDSGPRPMYACILWNDERHSFDEVIEVVMRATHCSKLQASKVAENVDAYGRHIVETSSRLDDLIPIATEISRIKLAVTIRSCKDTVREQICGLLLDWLKDLISGRFTFFGNVEGGNCILRDIICEVLCEDYSLRPELAALSTRSRRGTVSDNDLDFDFEFDGAGTEDEAGEGDTDAELFGGAMVVDDEDGMFTRAFVPDDDDIDWLEGDEDDDEYHPGGSDDDDYEEDDSDSDSDVGPRVHNAYTSQDVEMRNVSDDDENENRDVYHHLHQNRRHIHPETRTDAGDTTTSPPPHVQRSPSPSTTTTTAATAATSNVGNASSPALRTPPHRRHSPSRPHDIIDLKYDLNEWLTYTDQIEWDERNIATMLNSPLPSNYKLLAETDENIKREFSRKLRLDYLLQYDLRLWKTARTSIKDLLIGTLVSNFDYRPTIGVRFARNYPELLDAFFLKDREPEHSITTMSVQILTVPTVAALLVKDYKFFGIACSILANFFLTDSIHMLLPEEYHNMQVDCSSRAIKRPRFAMTFFDLRYILNAEMVKAEVCHQPLYLRHFLDMLFQFQAMDPLVRQDNVHVEYESTSWVNAFNVTLQISKLCRLFADCFASLYEQSVVTSPGSNNNNQDSDVQQKNLEATQSLVRSILRVLHALQSWSPKLTESASQAAALLAGSKATNTWDDDGYGYLIKGIQQQKTKSFESPAAGNMTIIKYDIAKEPVSFHHPYHWLLAELLSHVRLLKDDTLSQLGWKNGFKSVIDKFNEQEPDRETFLAVLEYPLRMRALLAQANCGVWVRNGFSIRNQARTYRDVSVREYTYDWDLYLLQVGLAMTQPDHLLATMIDRFNIVDWFNGKPEKPHPYYDASQMTTVVEEFTDFLVICATERGYASDMPIEDKIRRAIIQYLGLSSMAYSELVKVLPDSLSDHASFDKHLGELSEYKPPSGLNDHGRYELKDEYYKELDPYFWQFSRNQREEAFEKLRLRHNKNAREKQKQEVDKEEFFILPQLRKIPKDGPFKYFGNFLQSHMMVQIVLYALWNSRTTKSSGELILDDALYLAMVAVTDENTEAYERRHSLVKGKSRAGAFTSTHVDSFVEYACNDVFPVTVGIEREHLSLLTVLLRFMGDKEYKYVHQRCKYIIDRMEERECPAEAKQKIAEWRALHQTEQENVNEEEKNDAAAEYEKKKAAVKARQANIMAQFAQAQSQFMSQYADMYDDEEDEETMNQGGGADLDKNVAPNGDVERTCHFPAGTCIVCQEELDRSRLYGVLGLVQKSKTIRQTPLHNSEVLFDVLETAQGRDNWKQHMEATTQDNTTSTTNRRATPTLSSSAVLNAFPTDAHVEGLHISTCGHLMHAHCFNGYQESVDSDTTNPLRALMPQLRHKQFLCPLCKALGNVLLPIVWKGKKESYPGPMAPKTTYEDLGPMAKDLMNQLENEIGPGDRKMPGGIDEEVDPRLSEPGVEIENVDALRRLYNQLRTAMKGGNHSLIIQDGSISPGELRASLLELYNMYAYAIASIEIAQRGDHGVRARDLSVEHTGTFLDDISSQNQTLLKILAKTGELMPSVMNTRWVTDDRYTMQRISLGALRQIFYDEALSTDGSAYSEALRKPLLLADPFETLTRIGFIIKASSSSPRQHHQQLSTIDIHHFMRLLYVAEITKTVIGLLQGFKTELLADQKISQSYQRLSSSSSTARSPQEGEAAKRFACDIASLVGISETTLQDFFAQVPAHVFASLIRTFALPYLRKALLLMVVHHGFILQPLQWEQEEDDDEMMDDDDEYDYLARILRLPTFTQVFNLEPSDQGMLLGWCKHYYNEAQKHGSEASAVSTTTGSNIGGRGTSPTLALAAAAAVGGGATTATVTSNVTSNNTSGSSSARQSPTLLQLQQKRIISLRLPTPYYLVSLPYRMDQLFEESARRVCRKCNNLPEYPALCLVCGTFVCARRYCCTENDRGECNTHMRSCSGDVGIFLVIKESLVLLLHADGGSIMNAPYLDTHGEVDLFLRRGTPQYLNPQRYEQIRQMWLSHAVPAFVRRKMESSYSYTRWESW
ncbi:hypothetical protein BDA99DRAFT_554385 [Phascolomyces articulosus]|uniref:E3 ubiquitin-protein ligase n=1 Tax=Phascolomyces articulosus TaxID=60185 RepID=A0AAD5L0A6_9FUNG|nr:hypothetical protein BDA99DRAFT_554385 [Phascolomyces articulosus]